VKTNHHKNKPSVGNASTKLDTSEVLDLCAGIHTHTKGQLPAAGSRTLGLFTSIRLILLALRHNLTQELLAEIFEISQPTVSRIINAYVPLIAENLQAQIPTVEDLDPTQQLIIDGTLLPCWSWRRHPELYSGKHHTTGVTIQVACTLTGRLAWVSHPFPGNTHDLTALKDSRLLDMINQTIHIGDKGYTGAGMITPVKKPAGHELYDSEKEFNKKINTIRYLIERSIAQLKTWRILHTDYRRPYATFTTTINAVLGIIFTYTP